VHVRREILIDSAGGEVRAAVLEDDVLAEILIERPGRRGLTGNIYKGRVSNILPGMQSAFVDIGLERDAFLFVEDVSVDPADAEAWIAEAGESPDDAAAPEAPRARAPRRPIEDLLREGQPVVVQVAKDPLAQKGARITGHVSLPGRFLVLLPGVAHVGVSRRITDPAERARLKGLAQELVRELGLPGGCIVRTAGEGQAGEELTADARYLAAAWDEIRELAQSRSAPALLREELGAVGRVLRDLFHQDVARVVVDSGRVLEEALALVRGMQPSLEPRLSLHAGRSPLFIERAVQPQIDRALRSRVWLKSGGSIVINQTEALVAIDVNTGKYTGGTRVEDTVLKTNLEAATEIVRQVRLRDLGGIIVIDFIDMQESASREEVLRVLQTELLKDRSRSRMLQISEFGLVEITRQRGRPSLERFLCEPCPRCAGGGRVKSPETLYFDIVREMHRQGLSLEDRTVPVTVAPGLATGLREALARFAGAATPSAGPRIDFRESPDLDPGEFRLGPGVA
jgi:ribonuclease G